MKPRRRVRPELAVTGAPEWPSRGNAVRARLSSNMTCPPSEGPDENQHGPNPDHAYRQPAAAEAADRPVMNRGTRDSDRRCRVRSRDRQGGRRRRRAATGRGDRRRQRRRDEQAVLHHLHPASRQRHRAGPARRREGPRHHDRPRSAGASGLRPAEKFQRLAVSRLRWSGCATRTAASSTAISRNLKSAASKSNPTDVFMTAPSPGILTRFIINLHYPTRTPTSRRWPT